jgi:hypothetical protein
MTVGRKRLLRRRGGWAIGRRGADRSHVCGVGAMKRLCVLLGLAAGAGCVSEADRRQWDDAVRDLRGDNMRMRADGPAANGVADLPAPQLKPRD